MTTAKEIYRIWAPTGTKWTDWVRPVPFVSIDAAFKTYSAASLTIPSILYIDTLPENTAVILDLPGCDSVPEGLALAKLGFRPIPLYNGTNEQPGTMALVDNHTVGVELFWGASELEKIDIPDDAPPAFLLDSNRTNRHRMSVSVFDNSWDIYDQDLPTPEYFINNGINKIIVRGLSLQKDLSKILYKFQKKGIATLFTDGCEPPNEVTIKKPKKDKQ